MGKLPADYDGTTPHPDQRRERFAQLVARGTTRADAYRQAIARGDIGENTAKSNGMKIYRDCAVAARIENIRAVLTAERKVEETPLDRADLLDLMRHVTDSYQTAITALESLGGNPATVARLRSDLVLHVGRLHRLAPPRLERPTGGDGRMIEDGLDRLHLCACQRPGEGVTAP